MIHRPIANPKSPYQSQHAEWLEPPPAARLEIYEESSASVLTHNDSPDIPFSWSVNPYRGCQHACAYCYARPYHEYLDLGAGTDFETKLFAKTNAPELLRKAFSKKSWKREWVTFSGITDCYQPLEAGFGITRECLQVCIECKTPASIITKSYLVVRDIDVLTKLDRVAGCRVFVSIPFADAETAKLIEPQAPTPQRRFEAVRKISEAGIRVGVMVAPIIPGLNDRDIPSLLEQAAASGASSVAYVPLRLAGSVRPVFLERLREAMPDRAQRVIHRIRDIRGGKLNDPNFGSRMSGTGVYWDSIRDLFEISKKRFGFHDKEAIEERIRVSTPNRRSDERTENQRPKTNPESARPNFQFSLFDQ